MTHPLQAPCCMLYAACCILHAHMLHAVCFVVYLMLYAALYAVLCFCMLDGVLQALPLPYLPACVCRCDPQQARLNTCLHTCLRHPSMPCVLCNSLANDSQFDVEDFAGLVRGKYVAPSVFIFETEYSRLSVLSQTSTS